LAKKKKEQPPREVTKRQLSHWQQQKKRQRIFLTAGICVIVAVIGVMVAGWYINQYQPLHQTVISVNDTKFDMNYYIKMLKYYGQNQPAEYMQFMADEVARAIEQTELIRQGAMKLDITISDEEVDKKLESLDPPLSKDYRDLARAEMLITKLRDEYFEQEVPLFAEQRQIMAMFLESKNQAAEIATKLDGGEDFAELAGEFSLDSFSKDNKGDFGWRAKGFLTLLSGSAIPEEYAFDCEVGVLSQPIYDEAKTKGVGYWLIKVVERKEEDEEAADEVHVQAILLGSEEEAQGIKARLETGEDFTALAEEVSRHEPSKENGGDLGWLTQGTMSSAFDEVAFNSELEILSEPIPDETTWTKGGYWLVKVLDKDDNREIEGEDRDLMKNNLINEWVSSLQDDPENEVENYLDEDKKSWAIARATKELEQ